MKTSVYFRQWIAFIVLLGASAMKPNPNPYQVEQPDGSTITVQMVGSEQDHYEEDSEG